MDGAELMRLLGNIESKLDAIHKDVKSNAEGIKDNTSKISSLNQFRFLLKGGFATVAAAGMVSGILARLRGII